MHWAKVSALRYAVISMSMANSQHDVVAGVCLLARVCTADAWLQANTWRQKGTAPTSATWKLSCAAHAWHLATTRPIDGLGLRSDTAADDAASAISMLYAFIVLIAFHLTGLAAFLHCIVWRQLTQRY